MAQKKVTKGTWKRDELVLPGGIWEAEVGGPGRMHLVTKKGCWDSNPGRGNSRVRGWEMGMKRGLVSRTHQVAVGAEREGGRLDRKRQ